MLKHIIYIDQLPYIVIQLGWWAKWEYVQYILNVPKIVCKHRAILFHSIPHGCRRAKETVWSSLWFLWVWLYCSYLRLTNVSFSFKKPHVYFNTTRFNNLMTIHYAVLRTRGFYVIGQLTPSQPKAWAVHWLASGAATSIFNTPSICMAAGSYFFDWYAAKEQFIAVPFDKLPLQNSLGG